MKKFTLIELLMLVSLVVEGPPGVAGYANGAARAACDHLRPRHVPSEPQQTTNPYDINILDGVVYYHCGDTVKIRISSSSDRTEDGFLGFILQGQDETGVSQGVFDVSASSQGVRVLSCRSDNDTITHSDASVKQSLDLVWNAAPHRCSSTTVYFRGAVARHLKTFWADWNLKLPFRSARTSNSDL